VSSSPTFFPPAAPAAVDSARRVPGLAGSAPALYIVEQARALARPCLVVTASTTDAYRLEEELRFFVGRDDIPVLHFPDWETLPYDNFSPHQDLVSRRLEALAKLPQLARAIVVLPVTTLLHRLCPPSFVAAGLRLRAGERLDVTKLRRTLEETGYLCVDTVFEHGQFAVRGSLVDLFPMGHDTPVRIELLDDEVDTLRTFDPETQRSLEKVALIDLLPAREYPFTREALDKFRERFRERFDVDHRACPLYQDIQRGIAPPGIEYYQPLFFDRLATLGDYLPAASELFLFPGLHEAAETFWREVRERHEDRRHDRLAPILPPSDLFLAVDELFAALKQRPRSEFVVDDTTAALPSLPVHAREPDPVAALRAHLPAQRTLIAAESAGRREALLELLGRHGLHPVPVESWQEFTGGGARFAVTVAPLERGAELPGLSLVAEPQLFGDRVMQRRRRERQVAQAAENTIRNLSELRVGAPVVHVDAGVGRYLGLNTLTIDGQALEFLTLEYAEGAKLYVPVSNLHLIARWSGSDEDSAPLHKLGSDQWAKARRKAAEQVRDVAAELLDLHARRAARKGQSFGVPELDYAAFCEGFPFEETPDQQMAIDAVLADLKAPKPMDRLVCGDVGFGKTEVAVRAAFAAAVNGKQTLVLCPTTILAEQHWNTFKARYRDFPVRVEMVSRFRKPAETKQILKDFAEGKIEVLVGTHRVLSRDVIPKDLGLVILDEEQRFGVAQKELLRSLRLEVDVLALSATPIPRTLHMSLSGLRDISIIETPPEGRRPIRTTVGEYDEELIATALEREIARGGQAFYLHNRVETIEEAAEKLEQLCPKLRFIVAHGQMRERDLEEKMHAFLRGDADVLVSTTIIESGIDIPQANTLIVERADMLGLSQLYQIRGRVGRSDVTAHAYLLYPDALELSPEARARLSTLADHTELGAGFQIAMRDLEIRGAGDLLGAEQSGHVAALGFELYVEMLAEAVAELQGRRRLATRPVRVDARVDAYVPAGYVASEALKIDIHRRLALAESEDELRELHAALEDRYGPVPEPVEHLFAIQEAKLKLARLGADYLIYRGGRATVGPLVLGSAELRALREVSDTAVYTGAKREVSQRAEALDGAIELVDAIVVARRAA